MTAQRRRQSGIGRAALAFACAASATGGAHAEISRAVIDDPLYTHAQRLVDVGGGRKMNLYCSGSGTPTVILDAGLGDSTIVWGFVQPRLAARTQVCSYDRAGLGYSQPRGSASTSANIVADLHSLLRAAAIAPPYIMVGHSFGGMNVRLYTYRYPTEVAGIVLVDSTHEDEAARHAAVIGPNRQLEELLALARVCAAAATNGFAAGSELSRKCVDGPGVEPNAHFSSAINATLAAVQMQPAFQATPLSELENVFTVSADELRAARRSYADMPLVVLTAGGKRDGDASTPEAQLEWEMGEALAALSTRGVHRAVAQSGHYIQLDRPEAVVAAIDTVIAAVRSR